MNNRLESEEEDIHSVAIFNVAMLKIHQERVLATKIRQNFIFHNVVGTITLIQYLR